MQPMGWQTTRISLSRRYCSESPVAERSDATGRSRQQFANHEGIPDSRVALMSIYHCRRQAECDPSGIDERRQNQHRWRRYAQPPANY